VTTPLTTLVPEPARPVLILIPLAYIFLMLRRIFGQKIWLTALKTVPILLLFVVIEIATALAVVLGVTWANGHWG
jgi:ABC-type polysaccharide/polyol phosphate export permease